MKKVWKRLCLMLVALCLFVLVAACDNGAKANPDGNTPGTVVTPGGNNENPGGDNENPGGDNENPGNKDEDTTPVRAIAVSEHTYTTVREAVDAYLANELAYTGQADGNVSEEETTSVAATYVRHETKGSVAVAALQVPDTYKTGLTGAEKIAVTARVGITESGNGEVRADEEVTQTAYVLAYGEAYRYAVSAPAVGERLTNSYLQSLFAYDRYANCTVDRSIWWIEDDAEGEDVDERATFEYSESVIHEDDGSEEFVFAENTGICIYRYHNESVWRVGTRVDDAGFADYRKKSLRSYGSVFEILLAYPEAALYTATATGFTRNVRLVYEEDDYEDWKFAYTVTDGMITAFVVDYQYDNKMEGTLDRSQIRMTVTKIGTTVVTVPDDVRAAFDAAKASA